MRIEKVVVDLVNTSYSTDATADKLSRLLELTLRKVSGSGEAGAQAVRIVQARMVRDALTQDLNIKRLRARATPYLNDKPTSSPFRVKATDDDHYSTEHPKKLARK